MCTCLIVRCSWGRMPAASVFASFQLRVNRPPIAAGWRQANWALAVLVMSLAAASGAGSADRRASLAVASLGVGIKHRPSSNTAATCAGAGAQRGSVPAPGGHVAVCVVVSVAESVHESCDSEPRGNRRAPERERIDQQPSGRQRECYSKCF